MGWRERLKGRFTTRFQRDVLSSLARVEAVLGTSKQKGITIMATVQDLQARVDSMAGEVEQTRDIVAAVEAAENVQIALIQQLRDELAAGGQVPDEVLQSLDNTISVAQENRTRLAQLAAANTGGEPNPARRG